MSSARTSNIGWMFLVIVVIAAPIISFVDWMWKNKCFVCSVHRTMMVPKPNVPINFSDNELWWRNKEKTNQFGIRTFRSVDEQTVGQKISICHEFWNFKFFFPFFILKNTFWTYYTLWKSNIGQVKWLRLKEWESFKRYFFFLLFLKFQKRKSFSIP